MPILFDQDGNPEREKRDFELLPDGNYDAMIEAIDIKETQNGDPMWAVVLVVSLNGREGRVWDNVVWSKKAIERVWHFVKCFGLTAEKDRDYKTLEFIGKTAIGGVKIGHKAYKGKLKNTVPFDGYHTYPKELESTEQPGSTGDDIPF